MGDIKKGKLNAKNTMGILLWAILLISVIQFSGAQSNSSDKIQEDKTPKRDNEAKFESDFYEKLKIMDEEEKKRQKKEGVDFKPKEYGVYLWVQEPERMEENPDNFSNKNQIKDKIEKVLLEDHKASMANKAKVLSFVAARLPLTEILKLGDYYYIDLVGDGEREGEPTSLKDGKIDLVNDNNNRISKQLPIEVNMNIARGIANAATGIPNCADGSTCDGSGIKVAVIDDGIRQNHPDLPVGSKIVAQTHCFSNQCVDDGYYGTGGVNHGTVIAGIIAANPSAGVYKGIAPAALIMNAKSSSGSFPAAVDWAVANGAKVISLSKDFGDCINAKNLISHERAIDEAVENGVVVVAAVGNTGSNYVTRFACAFNVIAVGGVNDMNSPNKGNTEMYDSSSFGPTFDGRKKPDLVAPSVLIYSTVQCTPNGTNYDDKDYWNNAIDDCQITPVGNNTGTSFAAPFVAGAAALLLEKSCGAAGPSSPTCWTPAQIKAALKKAANNALINFPNIQNPLITDPDKRGAGVLDVAGALSFSSLSESDMSTWAYGFDIATYVARSRNTATLPATNNLVQFNFLKEPTSSTLSGGISANNGYFRQNSTSSPGLIFAKLSVPSIKINGVTKFLTDSNLFAGPRVDIRTQNASAFVTYKIGNERVQLYFGMTNKLAYMQVSFLDSLASNTYEVVQYSDYQVNDVNDRARGNPTGTPIATEKSYTNNKKLYLRDATSGPTAYPYVLYSVTNNPTEYLLKYHGPDANPAPYLNGENINPANIVIDYKKSQVGNGGTLTLGPKAKIIRPTGVQSLGPSDIWIIKNAEPDDVQDFSFTSPTLGNFTLDNDDELPIPSATLDRILFQAEVGSHTITEIQPPGWGVAEISCYVEEGGTSSFTIQGTSVTINFVQDGSVECTFENVPST